MRSEKDILDEIEVYRREINRIKNETYYSEFQKQNLRIQYEQIIGTLYWVLGKIIIKRVQSRFILLEKGDYNVKFFKEKQVK